MIMAQIETLHSEEIEVDSTTDIFGIVYRVWRGMSLLGTFYRSPVDELWVAEPFCCLDDNRYNTADEAQAAIVSAWAACALADRLTPPTSDLTYSAAALRKLAAEALENGDFETAVALAENAQDTEEENSGDS